MKNKGIKIKGHRGTWYVIDKAVYDGKRLYLLESEIWGDEVASLIVDEDCNVILDDVWNGFSDYEECLC
nr:MAG TPA: Large polyvalent protein-associated domain 18 [Caudoviricetes sp.]